jgi:phage head maturation protease
MTRIENGELKGFSIGGLVTKSVCQICGCDYVECLHITGEVYEGVTCSNIIEKCDLAEVSVVQDPANPLCNIKFKN